MALVHEPIGKPGGGLWGVKGMQLPAYIQHIRNDLMTERGMPEGEATATAINMCKRWRRGGGDVHPDTRAKATAALAELEVLKARAHAHSAATRGADMADYESDAFDASWDGDHSDLPDLTGLGVEEFEDADTGDDVSRAEVDRLAKLGSGGRFAALKSALAKKGARNPGALAAWIGRKKYGKGKFASLANKARSKKGGAGQAEGHGFRERVSRSEIFRYYPLEDIQILTRAEGERGGRIVEAYATVFDQEAEIHDQHGDYREVIDRTAFDATLARHMARGGLARNVKVLYNHGKTIEGAPAPEFQVPLGVPLEIRPEKRGLLTRTEYDPSDPLAERILSKIHAGAITTQSFVGAIMRSDPELRGWGDRYGSKRGPMPLVRRVMLGLREYGPVLFASYTGAEILGVRMSIPGDEYDYEEPDYNEDEGPAADNEAPGVARSREELPSSTDVGHRILVQRMGEDRPWRETKEPEWLR